MAAKTDGFPFFASYVFRFFRCIPKPGTTLLLGAREGQVNSQTVYDCGSKMATQNRSLVNGAKDSNLRSPGG